MGGPPTPGQRNVHPDTIPARQGLPPWDRRGRLSSGKTAHAAQPLRPIQSEGRRPVMRRLLLLIPAVCGGCHSGGAVFRVAAVAELRPVEEAPPLSATPSDLPG